MAFVENFVEIQKDRTQLHAPVHATCNVFHEYGRTIFQIDTYGSAEREFVGKVSQSIQFDKESAKLLIEKLKKTFDLE